MSGSLVSSWDARVLSRRLAALGDGRGAGHLLAIPVLSVPQVFELAERVSRRPVGNIRRVSGPATGSASGSTEKCAHDPSAPPRTIARSAHSPSSTRPLTTCRR